MIFSSNPYNVFWLSIFASDKQINKRYKELSQLLRIWELQEYDLDIKWLDYSTIRSEENINDAYTKLSHQTKKLKAMYLRFQLIWDEDTEAMSLLNQWSIWSAYKVWNALSKNSEQYLHNKAILQLLMVENYSELWRKSVPSGYKSIWTSLKKIIDSDAYRSKFKSSYNKHNEINLSDEDLTFFRAWLKQELAEDVFDLAEVINDSSIYLEFSSLFWVQAKELDDNKNVSRIFDEIKSITQKIESIKFSNYNRDTVFELIESLDYQTEQLKKLWLDQHPKYAKMIDWLVTYILKLALSLNQNWNDTDAYLLTLEAQSFNISSRLQNSITKNLKIIKDNLVHLNKPIPKSRYEHSKKVFTQEVWSRESGYTDQETASEPIQKDEDEEESSTQYRHWRNSPQTIYHPPIEKDKKKNQIDNSHQNKQQTYDEQEWTWLWWVVKTLFWVFAAITWWLSLINLLDNTQAINDYDQNNYQNNKPSSYVTQWNCNTTKPYNSNCKYNNSTIWYYWVCDDWYRRNWNWCIVDKFYGSNGKELFNCNPQWICCSTKHECPIWWVDNVGGACYFKPLNSKCASWWSDAWLCEAWYIERNNTCITNDWIWTAWRTVYNCNNNWWCCFDPWWCPIASDSWAWNCHVMPANASCTDQWNQAWVCNPWFKEANWYCYR